MSPEIPKAVVIVDDERSYLDLLSELLGENLNCPILTYARPHEALRALAGLDVGVIVTDYYMPNLNGLEFIQRARELLPSAAFLIITGHRLELTDEERRQLPELKAILYKPVNWRLLAAAIIRHWPDSVPPLFREDLYSL